MRIRKNDYVQVISGVDRNERGKVLSVDAKGGKLVVEGVNRAYKHVRPSQRNPRGGRLSVDMPIPVSIVMLVCRACDKPTRLGVRYLEDGSKERFCKKCGAGNGQVAPPRALYAKKT